MNSRWNEKFSAHKVLLLLLALLFCTYLRVSLLMIYPLLTIGMFFFFKWKLDRNIIFLFATGVLCWLFSFRNGIYLKYNLVSFYYFVPFLMLLLAVPQTSPTQPNTEENQYSSQVNYFRTFMNCLTALAVINNIPGIIQYLIHPYDDSFVGIYGSFTVSQNGLSLINAILFFYHLNLFLCYRSKTSLGLSLFFLVGCVMGFYGAGQMVLIIALVLTYLKARKKSILQLILATGFTLAVVSLIMKSVSPATFDYNVAIINKFLNPNSADAPRKIVVFRNYVTGYTSNTLDFVFGSGPGTFNSRSAFMVGSPTYFNVDIIKSDDRPYYFSKYAYTLWNETNTGPYDGFMNQPFSSILALLGEYGLLFVIILSILLVSRFLKITRMASASSSHADVRIETRMYRFCSIFLLLLLIIDNYIEYPEIACLILIIINLGQQQIRKAYNLI